MARLEGPNGDCAGVLIAPGCVQRQAAPAAAVAAAAALPVDAPTTSGSSCALTASSSAPPLADTHLPHTHSSTVPIGMF